MLILCLCQVTMTSLRSLLNQEGLSVAADCGHGHRHGLSLSSLKLLSCHPNQ